MDVVADQVHGKPTAPRTPQIRERRTVWPPQRTRQRDLQGKAVAVLKSATEFIAFLLFALR
jgi:hypothetical protein